MGKGSRASLLISCQDTLGVARADSHQFSRLVHLNVLREEARLQVLNSLLAEHMTLDQAATLMGVTTRHTRRILAAYQEKGVAAVAHGHRGRRPGNTTPDAAVAGVVRVWPVPGTQGPTTPISATC